MRILIPPANSKSLLLFAVILFFTFSAAARAQQQQQQQTPDATVEKTSADQQSLPTDFVTDGCTMWFNTGAFKNCCIQHDLDYYNRQGWQARLQADNRLFMCVAKKGFGYKLAAPVMWVGVRIFGSPWFPIHRKRRYAVKKTVEKKQVKSEISESRKGQP